MENRGAQASDGKGKSSSMQHGQKFNLQKAFTRLPGGGGTQHAEHQGGLFNLEPAGCSPEEQLEIHVFEQCDSCLCITVQIIQFMVLI